MVSIRPTQILLPIVRFEIMHKRAAPSHCNNYIALELDGGVLDHNTFKTYHTLGYLRITRYIRSKLDTSYVNVK